MPILVALCGLLAAVGILAAPPAPAGPRPSPSSLAPSVAAAAATSAAPGTGGGVPSGPALAGSAGFRAAGASRTGDLPRSLVYSGLFGLAISITGLTMIVRRRRLW